jgi:hypothetical protein
MVYVGNEVHSKPAHAKPAYAAPGKQQDILPLFGSIEYEANYHHKKERSRKRA